MKMQKRAVVAIACCCLLAGPARVAGAQTIAGSFAELSGKLKPGRTVSVTDEAGRKVEGKVTDLSPTSLKLLADGKEETFPGDQVRQITERRGNASKGAGIGFLVGGAFGLVSLLRGGDCPDLCNGTDSVGFGASMVMVTAGLGAAVGAVIGSARTHERVVYRAPNPHPTTTFVLSPIVSKHGGGLAASVRF